MTEGEKVISFIERYCRVPEGNLLNKPVELLDFQKKFILAIYDNPQHTSRAYLSIARKNAKTATKSLIIPIAREMRREATFNGQTRTQ